MLRLQEANPWPGRHGSEQNVAFGALTCVHCGIELGKKTSSRRTASHTVRLITTNSFTQMRLLFSAHCRRKYDSPRDPSTDRVLLVPAEMRVCTRKDVAPGALFLLRVWYPIRRGGLPRDGWQSVLPGGLLRSVRPKVRWLQQPHH